MRYADDIDTDAKLKHRFEMHGSLGDAAGNMGDHDDASAEMMIHSSPLSGEGELRWGDGLTKLPPKLIGRIRREAAAKRAQGKNHAVDRRKLREEAQPLIDAWRSKQGSKAGNGNGEQRG